jgi:hypothetical protein
MPSRAELVLRAAAVNVDETAYPNDSKLEQKVLYEESIMTATTNTRSTKLPAAAKVAQVSGGKNV